MSQILGHGQHRYEPLPEWGNLPSDVILGDVAGIAVDDNDRVYLFNRGDTPVVVLSQSGDLLAAWGQGIFTNPHGASIGPDQCLYLTDNFDHTVRKFTLDGKLLLEIGTAGVSSGFMSGRPFCKCTHAAISASGDIFVSDGYQNACIHKFDPRGNLLKSWGTPGSGPGEFNLPHNICCDVDGWVYVADRENSRVQVFDQNGRFETQINNMHRPSGLAITPRTCPACIVGELAPYLHVNRDFPNLGPFVTFMDQQSRVISRLNASKGPGLGAGQFLSPHSIAYDSSGDLYVGDVVDADWHAVMRESPKPEHPRRFQKLRRVADTDARTDPKSDR
ncbi:peptidyl-alpha-hydroxyglycine alpha-amidating lyase family protein [uncultured Roseobacter sp.]|uniref:peptidyl-alpha-hydroxyglycine alpha-amidating lyase family protein n=1 Tax=uncultured Roseobacter sp. TaxID=114847 RepID=UPI00262B41B6|nr:peptidyl-alpha-hydroxyglycine alpha-amidating lyase family protein [uncultured Roseobacter sp.]